MGAEGTGQCHYETLLIIFERSQQFGGQRLFLRTERKLMSYLQEKEGGGPGELHADQPHLYSWEGDGQNNPNT